MPAWLSQFHQSRLLALLSNAAPVLPVHTTAQVVSQTADALPVIPAVVAAAATVVQPVVSTVVAAVPKGLLP